MRRKKLIIMKYRKYSQKTLSSTRHKLFRFQISMLLLPYMENNIRPHAVHVENRIDIVM